MLFKDERAMPLFTIMLPALVTSAVYCVFRAWLLGKRDYLTYSVTELAEEVIRALLSVFLASGIISSLAGATGIAAAFTVSDVICAVLLIAKKEKLNIELTKLLLMVILLIVKKKRNIIVN